MLDQTRHSNLTKLSQTSDYSAGVLMTPSMLAWFDVLSSPVWIFDIEQMNVWWANRAALSLWNASSLNELKYRGERICSETIKIHFQQYLNHFQKGQTITERLTFYPQGRALSVQCICSGIQIELACSHYANPGTPTLESGRLMMLVEGIPQSTLTAQPKLAEVALYESQSKLFHLINSLPGIVFLSANDTHWSMKFLSAGCLTVTGYRPEELTSSQELTYKNIIHPEDLSKVAQTITTAVAQRQSYEIKYRIRTKTRREKWLWEKGNGIFDELGWLQGVEGFITDITELKQTEAALRASEERFRTLVETSSDWVWEVDENAVYIYVSSQVQESLGYTPEAVLGKTPFDLMPPEEARRVADIFTVIAEQQVSFRCLENTNIHKTGHLIVLETNGVPIFSADGKFQGYRGMNRDITERKRAEKLLASQKRILEMIASNATLVDTLTFLIQTMEEQFQGMLGAIRLLDLEGIHLRLSAAPNLPTRFIEAIDGITLEPNADACSKAIDQRHPVIVSDLSTAPLRASYQNLALSYGFQSCWSIPIFSSGGQVVGTFAMYSREVRTPSEHEWELIETATHLAGIAIERKQAETALQQAESKYRSIFENITQGIFQTTSDGRYLSANPALARLYGYDSPQDLLENLKDIEHQLYVDPKRRTQLLSLLEQGLVSAFESQVYRRDGSKIWVSETTWAVNDSSGELLYYEGTVEDITYRRLAEAKLLHDALHDSLTGLPNRVWFIEQLKRAIALSAQHPKFLYAVLFIDLDGFKVVNDSLGHLVGDELIKNVAQRLQRCLRAKDKIARFGGDEFAILLENVQQIREVIKVAERIQERLRLSFKLNHERVFTGASIGITFSSIGYERSEDLLRDADVAMYQAKAQGKGCYVVFNPGMQIAALARLQLENDLRRALERQEFCLHYQPIISLSTGHLTSFEALIRWNHPARGWVSPVEFIPIAEETGLINEIGWWVFQEACRQLQLWKQQFSQASALIININLSTYQLKQVGLVEKIENILHASGLEGREVKLEITESCFLETVASEAAMVQQLKTLGVSLCIDDFGTGYSSLSRLHEFPIDTLKIDRSFIRSLESSQTAIVQTIITLAHSLEMNVVAEGIETPIQLKKLQSLGCELGQGYLFSQPVDSQTASQLVSSKGRILTEF